MRIVNDSVYSQIIYYINYFLTLLKKISFITFSVFGPAIIMHQSNYTPANGAGMQHQPSFNPVPQSQQQQSSGQSNHNQQTTGAQQRHHPSYQSYPAQVRPQQPGSAHPNQQGQRIMQYNQGTNPHTGTTNYIPGVSIICIITRNVN